MKLPFLYGTAWKEEQTASLVFLALQSGFRGIDTANQRKHYFEAGVGEALEKAYNQLDISRHQLFLQTKFTYERGQDHRLPYNPSDKSFNQVLQSFESSLKHLQTDYIDSYLIHGPEQNTGLTDNDFEVWSAFSELYKSGHIRHLGVSNFNFEQLVELYQSVDIKPSFIQNRCFARQGWDKQIRQFCNKHSITYQGFSLLTANREFLGGSFYSTPNKKTPTLKFDSISSLSSDLKSLQESHQQPIASLIFKFAQQIGMLPLTGTTNKRHMLDDLNNQSWSLSEKEIEFIENIAF